MDTFLKKYQHLKIPLEEIKSSTCNFDKNNVIGKGGFGMVYKGVLSHSKGKTMVAFKRLDRNYGQGDPEFLKEILMLSRYTHENLISLLGFCDEDGEKILVYELASHGSLYDHLSITTLGWKQRLKICLGAALGLCHLHDPKETQHRVIHGDIKSSNILLDENWNAKVSDFGLSKVGPANQQHTFLVTNVVGTYGYIDPLFMETFSLTKESDVYSFGVVLFEVLCGTLSFEIKNGHFQSLVRAWKQSFKEKKLDEIIFQDLKQKMDMRSLETFSNIAYQCLHESREERPKMSHVVEKLEIALRFQEAREEVVPPFDYEKMCKSAEIPLFYKSEEELKRLLSNGILVNNGKTWFCLNKNGEHCEMISAAECLIPSSLPKFLYGHARNTSRFTYDARHQSRFEVDYRTPFYMEFTMQVGTQFLSPYITYTINLVFSLHDSCEEFKGLTYVLAGETKSWTSYHTHKREDGWLIAELYQFTTDIRNVDIEITFECPNAIEVEGIEFQPLEGVSSLKRVSQQVGYEVLEGDEVDLQTISDSYAYWKQNLPSDYKDIIKRSKQSVQWRTLKELYSIFFKGFPINDGEEWFSLAKNGKKCQMLGASLALQKNEWSWKSSSESRFKEVAFGERYGCRIHLRSEMLSPHTTYATYLVYKLHENHSESKLPLKVHTCCVYGPPNPRYAYISGGQTPILRPKDYQNPCNPLNRPKKKGIPLLRNNGWTEVQVWEFRTDTTTFSTNLQLTFYGNESPTTIIVKGIELKPIDRFLIYYWG